MAIAMPSGFPGRAEPLWGSSTSLAWERLRSVQSESEAYDSNSWRLRCGGLGLSRASGPHLTSALEYEDHVQDRGHAHTELGGSRMIWRLDGGVHHAEAGGVQGGKKGRKKERKKESKKA
jgi:hypothetical protein